MNKNIYLNFMFTVLTVAFIFFGWMMINSQDRMYLEIRKLQDKLSVIEERFVDRSFAPAATAVRPAAGTREKLANAAFFDPDAQSGGRLISVISADTPNMNPLINNEATVGSFWSICNSSLAERNYAAPEKFQPLLAESWTVSPDRKVFTIKLRRGALWHDFTDPVTGKKWHNREVTARDFKFYLDVIKNKDVNCSPIRVYFQDLERIEIISDYEFKVYWKKKYFMSEVLTLGLSPLPRHLYHAYPGPFDGKKFNNDHRRNRVIVGCGPYRFLRWDKDQRVIFVRFEKYFGRKYGIMPALKYRVFDVIKHPNTRFQSLLAGKTDRLGLTPDQWVKRAASVEFTEGMLEKYKYLGRVYFYIGYNLTNPLFKDKRVRRALTHLVNREKILKDVYFGLGKIVTGPFFMGTPYNDKSIKPYKFDIEQARKLLAAAGWKDIDADGILEKDGRKFEFTIMQVANHPIQQKMLPIIKEDMAKAGIKMMIRTYEWSVYLERLQNKAFEVCTLGWALSFESDPYQLWHSSQADKKHSSNHVGFKNAQADKLIEEIRATFDVKKRIELCHQFHRLLHEEQPYTFLFSPYSLLAQSGRYRNVRKFESGVPEEIMWTPKDRQLRVPGM